MYVVMTITTRSLIYSSIYMQVRMFKYQVCVFKYVCLVGEHSKGTKNPEYDG